MWLIPNSEIEAWVIWISCPFYFFVLFLVFWWESTGPIAVFPFSDNGSLFIENFIFCMWEWKWAQLFRFFRIGSIILALHDACDIFLEAAKVFKYSGVEMGASICFGLFAVTWLLLRLLFFPFWVIKSSRFVTFIWVLQYKGFIFKSVNCCYSWIRTIAATIL